MRVAHVVPQFHPEVESIATFALRLARHQRLAGVNAEVVTLDRLLSNPSVELPAHDCVQGVPVRRISYVGSRAYPLALGVLSCIEPFDIVHVHGTGFFRRYLALTRMVHRKPLVISTHIGEFDEKQRLPLASHFWTGVARRYVQEYESVLGWHQREILGVAIRCFTRKQAIERIDHGLRTGERLNVCFANSHTLNISSKNGDLRNALEQFLVLNDGLGLDIASTFKFGKPFMANLNGTDFVPAFLAMTRHKLRLYLVGSTDPVVAQAAMKLRDRYPWHSVVGWRNGFFTGSHDIEETCRNIRAMAADCVLVGMGNPLQEFWIANHAAKTGARLLFGVGALFDFEAERVGRAPMWVRNLRCEWIYRLLQEPSRLARRYLIGNVVFLSKVIADARSQART